MAAGVLGQHLAGGPQRAGAGEDRGVDERNREHVATGLVGLGLPELLLTVVLSLLAVASLVTVVQRMLEVRRQAVVDPV